jgi:hypothetical protein
MMWFLLWVLVILIDGAQQSCLCFVWKAPFPLIWHWERENIQCQVESREMAARAVTHLHNPQ